MRFCQSQVEVNELFVVRVSKVFKHAQYKIINEALFAKGAFTYDVRFVGR